VNLDNVPVHLAVLLATRVEFLVDFDVVQLLARELLDDEDHVGEGEEDDVQKTLLVDQEQGEFVEVLAGGGFLGDWAYAAYAAHVRTLALLFLAADSLLVLYQEYWLFNRAKLLLQLIEPIPPHNPIDGIINLGQFPREHHLGLLEQLPIHRRRIAILNDLLKQHLVPRDLISGLEQLVGGGFQFEEEVTVADLADGWGLGDQFQQEVMRVLGLVDVVDVQLEERDHGLDDVAVGLVLVVGLVTFQQDLVQLLVELLDLLNVAEQ